MRTLIARLAEKVAEGAMFMDTALPEWSEIVEPALLDIGHPEWCILGQCFGTYGLGLLRLDLNPMDEDEALGLTGRPQTYHILTELWIEQIKQRKQGANDVG